MAFLCLIKIMSVFIRVLPRNGTKMMWMYDVCCICTHTFVLSLEHMFITHAFTGSVSLMSNRHH